MYEDGGDLSFLFRLERRNGGGSGGGNNWSFSLHFKLLR
jgi:hypothetical protein